ncbi:MAG: hypothetical protein RLZZ597_3274 [Cyanobacteriota bacterium]|jgi:glycosyltransferase involved in cell wall biosynthesis
MPSLPQDCPLRLDLSVVVPLYNEVESVDLLIESLSRVLENVSGTFEILCIDDGSTDGTAPRLRQLVQQYPRLRAILLRRNYGQTAALAAGFDAAQGHVIVTMDGDLQHDPTDIPRLLARLDAGYDLVSGWRQDRQDNPLTRRIPSWVANWVIAQVTGVPIHDYGCTLKAYRAEVIRDLNLYGELHRFLPALAVMEGARVAEIPVHHRPRPFGTSKYGLGRTQRVMMDLLTVYFMKTFLTRPMHIFGGVGGLAMVAGVSLGLYLSLVKVLADQDIGDRPLLVLAVVLFLAGIQLFSLGLLAELMMRTYHESQQRPIYRIREVLGAGDEV